MSGQLSLDGFVHHGFTGTEIGWSAKQHDAVFDVIYESSVSSDKTHVLHHGDCVGADANAHEIAFEQGWHIIVHPPTNARRRAFVHNSRFWDAERCTLMPERAYLDRNRDIVAASIDLIATPAEKTEQLRSGTWATVRYAKAKPIPVFFAFRDGVTRWEEP